MNDDLPIRESGLVLSSPDFRTTDARKALRSSMYLGAALYCDSSCTPVRIRNMSAGGALIEGAALPKAGAIVQLVRGTLIIHGLVAWSVDGRCGLRFPCSVDVQQWLACPSNAQQQRVDEVVRLVKAGAVPLPVPTLGEGMRPREPLDAGEELPEDLRRVSKLLEQVGDLLASDPHVVLQHGSKLQNLDIATQVIAAIEEVITGHHDRGFVAAKLAGLRRSADEALLRQG